MPLTWGGSSTFKYSGSVEAGVKITYGKGWTVRVTAEQFSELRTHFLRRKVPVGTSRTNPSSGSLGEWLQTNVTRTAIASYVAPILVEEGYAERVGNDDIRITR